MKQISYIKQAVAVLICVPLFGLTASFILPDTVAALSLTKATNLFALSQCGSNSEAIYTSINFGCAGANCPLPNKDGTYPTSPDKYCNTPHSAIVDLLFAVIRFISDGIGLIIIMSLIIAGIQYTTSQGDPSSAKRAMERIRSTATALALFIFAYAILNYIIPNGFFGQ